MRKALIVGALGSLLLLATSTSASAHADLKSSTPRNGAVVAAAPPTVVLTFSEPIAVDEISLLNAKAEPIASSYKTSGATLTVTPKVPLSDGSNSVQWKAQSDDGHTMTGAIAFIVGTPASIGKPQKVQTRPNITTALNGSRSGPLSIGFKSEATSGEVAWTNPAYEGPFTWRVTGNGKEAKASGILPTSGKWSMQATLVSKGGSVIVTNGVVSLG